MEVQLHVDVHMRQKAGNSDHENKIRRILCNGPSAKIYTLEIYPLYGSLHRWADSSGCTNYRGGLLTHVETHCCGDTGTFLLT